MNDFDALPDVVKQALISSGRVFCTSYRRDGVLYGGHVVTKNPEDWEEAAKFAGQQNARVVGVLVAEKSDGEWIE